MSGTVADDSKDVLDKIKAEGTFDQMRVQVTEAVKKTVPYKRSFCTVGFCFCFQLYAIASVQDTMTSRVQRLVANSDVFKSGKAENMSRKELFDHIRKNHE